MLDIEDPGIFADAEPKIWTTAEANRALAAARKVLASIRIYVEETAARFKQEPQLYWGRWWWERLVAQVRQWFPGDLEFFKRFYSYNADYTPPMEDVPEWKINLWQFTSSPVPPVKEIKVLNGARVDVARWLLSDQAFDGWAGVGGRSS